MRKTAESSFGSPPAPQDAFEAALSPGELGRLTERARFVSAVHEGLADAEAGRVMDHEEVVSRMRSRAQR